MILRCSSTDLTTPLTVSIASTDTAHMATLDCRFVRPDRRRPRRWRQLVLATGGSHRQIRLLARWARTDMIVNGRRWRPIYEALEMDP